MKGTVVIHGKSTVVEEATKKMFKEVEKDEEKNKKKD